MALKSNHHLWSIRLVFQWKVERFFSRLVLQAENILSTIRSHLGSSGIESALERIGIGSAVLGIRAIVLIDREY